MPRLAVLAVLVVDWQPTAPSVSVSVSPCLLTARSPGSQWWRSTATRLFYSAPTRPTGAQQGHTPAGRRVAGYAGGAAAAPRARPGSAGNEPTRQDRQVWKTSR